MHYFIEHIHGLWGEVHSGGTCTFKFITQSEWLAFFLSPNLLISLDVPVAPRALIVAVPSPNSVVASWVSAQMVQTDPLLPIHYEVTLTDLGTGQILRRSNVSSADGVGQPEQLYDNLVPGSYGIAVTAGNVFGRSKSLSLNFNITGIIYILRITVHNMTLCHTYICMHVQRTKIHGACTYVCA